MESISLVIPGDQVAQFKREFFGDTPLKEIQDDMDDVLRSLVDLWPGAKIVVSIRVECPQEAYKE